MANAIQDLQHSLLDPDPNNPRKIFNEQKLQELSEDILLRGILQPIVARPHPKKSGRLMIIFGERRWRAAKGLETVPVIVREMSDVDAYEAQVSENAQRDDLHPLEEADAFLHMQEKHGRSVEEIAAICSRTKAYVYAALKLCDLSAESRKAFLEGKLDKSKALLIARLPREVQKQACRDITQENRYGEVPSFRDAASHLRRNYMLRLVNAPFATGDGLLVEKAGPCTTCPKRTGNQRELFEDVIADKQGGGADVCTDPKCYKEKTDAHWKRMKNEAEARDLEVLEGKAAANAGQYGDKKLLDLDRTASDLGFYDKTYRQVLGKDRAQTAVVAVARNEIGEIRELVSREQLPKLLKDAGVKAKPTEGVRHRASPAEKKRREEAKLQAELDKLAGVELVEAILVEALKAKELELWRLLGRMAARAAWHDQQSVLRKQLQIAGEDPDDVALYVYATAPERTVADLQRFVLRLLLCREPFEEELSRYGEAKKYKGGERAEELNNLEDAADVLGVDVKAIVKKVKTDHAAAEKEKPAIPAKAKSEPKKSNGVPAAEAQS